ncbi:MAG: transporter substrate-binding domain-containing protein [Pseudomonadota bacterium]
MRRLLAALAALAALAGLAGPGGAQAAEPIKLYYFQRPPLYMQDDQGRPAGVLLELAGRIMQRAGLEHSLVEVPAKRALLAIERNELACAVGWYRLAARERYATFSLPIHRDAPQVAVVRRSAARDLPRPATLDDLMGRPLTLGLIDGFYYGPLAERKIDQHQPRLQRITGQVGQLMHMAALGRCDWLLANRQEADWHLGHDTELSQELCVVELSDHAQGNLRHLMCGPSLGRAAMDRIDQAILALVGDLRAEAGPRP